MRSLYHDLIYTASAHADNPDNPILEPYLREWERVYEKTNALCVSIPFPEPVIDDGYEWTVVTSDDFQMGYGNFDDGGDDTKLVPNYEDADNQAALIRDGSSSSTITHSASHDVSSFDALRVKFWYKGNNMKVGDSFVLEYSSDQGSSWVIVKIWDFGSETFVENSVGYQDRVILTSSDYALTSGVKFRFRNQADGNDNEVYIDDVEFSAGRAIASSPSGTASLRSNMVPARSPTAYVTSSLTPTAAMWTTISFDDFENGPGNFAGRKGDAGIYRYSDGQHYAKSGKQSIQIRDNSGAASSFTYGSDISLSGYEEVRVSFWYMGDESRGFDTSDSFVLEFSSDSGANWVIVKRFVFGSKDFAANNVDYETGVHMFKSEYGFTDKSRFRFRSDAGGDSDNVYIDDVEIAGKNKTRLRKLDHGARDDPDGPYGEYFAFAII